MHILDKLGGSRLTLADVLKSALWGVETDSSPSITTDESSLMTFGTSAFGCVLDVPFCDVE